MDLGSTLNTRACHRIFFAQLPDYRISAIHVFYFEQGPNQAIQRYFINHDFHMLEFSQSIVVKDKVYYRYLDVKIDIVI